METLHNTNSVENFVESMVDNLTKFNQVLYTVQSVTKAIKRHTPIAPVAYAIVVGFWCNCMALCGAIITNWKQTIETHKAPVYITDIYC